MKDYCPHCHKVTEHVKDDDEKICKRCGRKEKRNKLTTLLTGR